MYKNNKLKKKIGEKAYNFLQRNFNDDFVIEHLSNLFGQLSDIKYMQEQDYPKLKTLLNRVSEDTNKKAQINKTAKELLNDAGFILIDNIENKSDYIQYKKYFESNEVLCKFDSYDATDRYSKLFFILRKDIDNIKRTENPQRQDVYSTSCMSVGISKDKSSVVQITSRYNHSVSGCDNTYNSNLDNIVEGLTQAINQDYGLNIAASAALEFDNFYFINQKYFYYYQEVNGVKYGNNTINGVIYDPNEFLVFDYFLLDIKNKKISTGCGSKDSFCDIINERLSAGWPIQIIKNQQDKDIENENKIIIYVN